MMGKDGKLRGVYSLLEKPFQAGSSWSLGQATGLINGNPTDTMILSYIVSTQTFYLSGQDDNNTGIILYWNNIGKIQGIMTLVNVSFAWEQTERYVKPEYSLLLMLQDYPGASNATIVKNKTDANDFYSFYSRWYQEVKNKG